MTIPPEENSILVDDIFLWRFPSDSEYKSGAPEGDGTVKTELQGNAMGAAVAEAQQAVLRGIFGLDKVRIWEVTDQTVRDCDSFRGQSPFLYSGKRRSTDMLTALLFLLHFAFLLLLCIKFQDLIK
ncbi:hypothetical protein ID80_004989 [Salmonella enterica subsp. enterica serovar Ball]|nr:hypothetical protein [Salmonella enterica subsp. enterica serovar Minnesota]ECI4647446.1 hypothetical protein [Salmonella enterica subsp. salamae]EDV5024275.1 hypothetical protein [Salmonella enterica subsp. enterica serovar Ball]